LIDGGTSITDGALTFGTSSDMLDVEGAGSPAATLDDVTVTGGGTIDVGTTTTTATAATLLIDGGTSIADGALTFGASSDILDVEGAGNPAATLDDVTVTGGGTIDVGTTTTATAATLLIDGGSITGGTINVGVASSYTPLDDSNATAGSYPYGTEALAVSGGEVAGYYGDVNAGGHGFIYSAGTFTDITDPSAATVANPPANFFGQLGTFVQGVDSSGEAVGYYINAVGLSQAFLYQGGSNYTDLNDTTDPAYAAGDASIAYGINTSGAVVGDFSDASFNSHGWVYSGGVYTPIDDTAATSSSYAYAINDSGDVLGYYFGGVGQPAVNGFIYSASTQTYTTVADPNAGSIGTIVVGFNNSDNVAGSFYDANNNVHGFIYNPNIGVGGTYTEIDDPSAVNGTFINAINDAGQVVGYYIDANNIDHAFLYSGGLYFNLDPTGVGGDSAATGIDNAGDIVGNYIDGAGEHGFLGTIPAIDTLQLNGGALLSNITLNINAFEVIEISAAVIGTPGPAITFDNVTAANAGVIVMDQWASLLLDGGTSINGGTLSIGDLGNGVEIGAGGATLDGVGVINPSTITVDTGATLNLVNTVIWGGSLAHAGSGATAGAIVVSGAHNISTLNGSGIVTATSGTAVAVPVSNSDTITVRNGAALELAGSIVNTGTINVGTGAPGATLVIGGDVDLAGGGTISLGGSLDAIIDAAGIGGTLDTDNTIVGAGTIGSQDGVFAIDNTGIIDATGTLVIDTGGTTINGLTNGGSIEAASGGNLEIEYTKVTNSGAGSITVSAGGTLTLENNSHIAGGSIVNNNLVQISVTALGATAELSGGTLTNNGTLSIGGDSTLTFSTETISGGTIDNSSVSNNVTVGGAIDVIGGSTITGGATLNGGSVTMGARLTLDGSAGTIVVNGTDFTTEQNHSLSIAGTVSINGGTITDDGHVTVGTGGVAPVFGTLVLDDGVLVDGSGAATTANGTLTLNPSSILDVEAGTVSGAPAATLKDVVLTGGGTIEIDASALAAATLLLDGGSKITGGAVTFGSTSDTLDVENISGGATLDNVNVGASTAGGAIEVGVTSTATVLTLDGGATISAGTLTIGSATTTGEVDIGAGGATLAGVGVTNYAGEGSIVVGGTAAATLTLESGTDIASGSLTVNSHSSVVVEGTVSSGADATFDGLAVTNSGTITVDPALAATLLLDDGTSIGSGSATGKLIIDGSGTLDVETGTATATPSATLDGIRITDNNTIEVGVSTAGATLLLDGGTTVTGNTTGALQIGNATLTASGTGEVDIEGSAPVTLDNVNVSAFAGGTEGIEIAATSASGTLLLNGGTAMIGGTLAIGSAAGTGLVDVESTAGAIFKDVIVSDYAATDGIEVAQAGTSTLTLESGTAIAGGALTIGTSTSTGTVSVEGPTGATLDGVAVTMGSGGKITVDPVAGALTLEDGTSISGGAMTIGTVGTLDVDQGSNSAPGPYGATFGGGVSVTVDTTVSNHGVIDVASGATLTLDGGASITVDFTHGGNDSIFSANAGVVVIEDETLGAASGDAFGAGATVFATGGTVTVENDSTFGTAASVHAADAGTAVTIDGGAFGNSEQVYGATGGTVEITGGTFGASDQIYATTNGSVTIEPDSTAGTTSNVGVSQNIFAEGTGSSLTIEGSTIGGSLSSLYAQSGGTLLIEGNSSLAGGNLVYASDSATVTIESASSLGSGDDVYADGTGSQVTIDGTTIAGGDVDVYASAGGTVTIEGSDNFDATGFYYATGTGSSLTIDTASLGGNNTVAASGGGTLTLDDVTTLASGDVVTLSGGSVTIDNDAIDGNGALAGKLSDVTSVTADGGNLDITGLTLGTVSATVESGATLTVGAANETVTFGSAADAGTIDVAAGTLDVSGAVNGVLSTLGSTQIDTGATFEIGSTDAETVTFNGGGAGGTFVIDHAADYTGTVGDGSTGDFASGDTIDLKDVTFSASTETDVWSQTTTGNGATGTLTIYSGSTAEASINLAGTYSQNDFELQGSSNSGASGSTEVVWNPAASTVSQQSITFASGSAPSFENGHWVVDDGLVTLSGVHQVTITGGQDAGTYLLVDNQGGGGYTSIQSAVDAATSSNETILVAPSATAYREQVTIDNPNASGLTITAANGSGTVIVDAPTTLDQTAVSPVSGDAIDGLFTVNGVNGVTISNITVNGLEYGDESHFASGQAVGSDGEGPSLAGIAYVNASGGTINGDTISGTEENPADIGAQRNFGIVVTNTDPLSSGDIPTAMTPLNAITVENSNLSSFQKDGILVQYADATISNNTLVGAGEVDTAQNAIEVGGSTGTVSGNTINQIAYSGDVSATGVLAYFDYNLDITGNHFTGALAQGSNTPLVSPVAVFVLDSNTGEIENNTAANVDNGVAVLSDAFGDDLTGTWTISNNTTTNVVPFPQGGSIFFDPDPTTSGTFTVSGAAGDVGDIFFVSPGTDILAGGGGGDNAFVVLNGSDLGTGDSITGAGSGNTIYFSSTNANDTLTIGSNVSGIQNVDIAEVVFAAVGVGFQANATALTVDASAYNSALTITLGTGDDTIVGNSAYIDTAAFGAVLTGSSFSYSSVSDDWTVTGDGISSGTDNGLSAISVVTDGASTPDKFLLVDPASHYNTLASAVTAANAAPTDVIVVGSGTLTSNTTLSGLTIADAGLIQFGNGNTAATVTLNGGTKITGGDLQVSAKAKLDVEAGTSAVVPAAIFDDVTVGNANIIEVAISAGATLLLDGGSSVTANTLTIGSGVNVGVVDVESGGATLNDVTVNDAAASDEIEVGQTVAATLTMVGGTTMTKGLLVLGAGSIVGMLDVESPTGISGGATLNNVSAAGITGHSDGIEVGQTSISSLTLESVTLSDATLTIGGSSTVTVESGTTTFDQVSVTMTSGSTLQIDPGATTVLVVEDGTTITDGLITIGNKGALDVEAGSGNGTGATIDGVGVTVSAGGAIEIGALAAATGAVLILGDDASSLATTITLAGTNADINGYGTLDNDATIQGYGLIGGSLALNNGTSIVGSAVIDANNSAHTLTLDPTSITNYGTIEATNSGILAIDTAITNSGNGSVVAEGGTVQLAIADPTLAITFNNGTGGSDYGELVLAKATGYSVGEIYGFAGTAAGATTSDEIVLTGFGASHLTYSSSSAGGITTLTLSSNTTAHASLEFAGNVTLVVQTSGSNVDIFDPPASTPSTPNTPVTIGGPGDDHFVFNAPDDTGADHSKWVSDNGSTPPPQSSSTPPAAFASIGNDHFVFAPNLAGGANHDADPHSAGLLDGAHIANAQAAQDLHELIASEAHGDVALDHGLHDGSGVPDVTPQLQQAIHAGHTFLI
jgi:probable HAF family extracellular repeat protein